MGAVAVFPLRDGDGAIAAKLFVVAMVAAFAGAICRSESCLASWLGARECRRPVIDAVCLRREQRGGGGHALLLGLPLLRPTNAVPDAGWFTILIETDRRHWSTVFSA
jgi:hypothetical protein